MASKCSTGILKELLDKGATSMIAIVIGFESMLACTRVCYCQFLGAAKHALEGQR